MNRIVHSASVLALIAATTAAPVMAQDVSVEAQAGASCESFAAGEAPERCTTAAEEALDAAGDAVTRAGEAAEQGLEAAGDALDEAAAATGEAVQDGIAATGDAIEETAEGARNAADEALARDMTEPEMAEGGVEADVEGVVEGQIVMQDEDSVLVRDVLGASVYSADGESIGEIDNMIVSLDGKVEGVVIGVGGFLGIGEKDVALKMSQIDVRQDADGRAPQLVTSVSRAQLETAVAFVSKAEQRMRAPATGVDGSGATVTE